MFVAAVFFGFGIGIFAINLMKSIARQRTQDAIDIQASHLQIHRRGFTQNKEPSLTIDQAEALATRLRQMPNVAAVAQRLSLEAVIASPTNSMAGEAKGVLPAQERRVSVLQDFIVAGSYLSQEPKNEILISQRTADKLKLKLKSKVVLTLKDAQGEIVGGAFKVVGIFVTPSTPFDEATFLLNYDDLAELAQLHRPHEIAIKLSDPDYLTQVETQIKATVPAQLTVENWKELLPELHAFDGFLNMVGLLLSVIIIIGLGFSLLNTMNMIVQERSREIGVLRAIGLGKSRVFLLLLKEAGLMMLMGATLGIALGVALVGIASKTGVRLTDDGGALGIRPVVYPGLHPEMLLVISGIALVLTLLVSALPAFRALGIKPLNVDRS